MTKRKTETTEAQPDRVEHVVYVGHRYYQLTSGKAKEMVAEFLIIDQTKEGAERIDEDVSERRGLYDTKVSAKFAIGDCIELPMVGSQAFFGRAKENGVWPSGDAIARWTAQHHAHRLAKRADSEKIRRLTERLDLKRLQPFKRAYLNLPLTERSALLVMILKYVTG